MMELIVLNILNFKTFKVEGKSTALAIFAVIQIFKGADLKFYSTKKKKKKKKKKSLYQTQAVKAVLSPFTLPKLNSSGTTNLN